MYMQRSEASFVALIIMPMIFLVIHSSIICAQAPPVNDNFASATVLTGSTSSVTGNSNGATRESGEPQHAGNAGGRSVWYKWTEGNFQFSPGRTFTTGNSTNFNTLLAVYTGTNINNLTLVASSNDYAGIQSTVFFRSVPNTTYYIAIDGFAGASGSFGLSWDINRRHADSNEFLEAGLSHSTVFRPSNGAWYSRSSAGFQQVGWGVSSDIPAPADFSGDGITDHAVFRSSTGTWYVLVSGTNSVRVYAWGSPGDKPVPGDYNGDGYADLAVFRPSNGTWYVASGPLPIKTGVWGMAGDKPVPRDFDNDGSLDFTVFRPSNGTWYVLRSLDNSALIVPWGTSEDIPVPGGYSSTGLADFAVWRPSNGTWYILRTHDFSSLTIQWGQQGDIPQPVNHNVSTIGIFDLTVFRPSTGTWWVYDFGGSTGTSVFQFGSPGDIPVSTPYQIQP